ncbi:MAG TPA: XdhC family protein [Streptosporangiaceae bacterium]|nr:XdhC family protein [Streptosporangiaceae bacterium]
MSHPHDHAHDHSHDGVACDVAHGTAPAPVEGRSLIAVFATPVARYLLRYAADAGYQPVLVEPDPDLARDASAAGLDVRAAIDPDADPATDVVVTDHHRDEIGVVLRDALATKARWVGIMGSPRVEPPHLQALALLGVEPDQISRVHRPIGLNIGSKTPPEIAIATLAGLIADRNERPGGFAFP